MKKIIVLLMSVILTTGCTRQKIVRADVYTLSTCGACQACVNDLEKMASTYDQVYLTIYDLDESMNLKKYQRLNKTYHLKNVLPAVKIGDMFFCGYDAKTKKKIHKALMGLVNK